MYEADIHLSVSADFDFGDDDDLILAMLASALINIGIEVDSGFIEY